VYQDQSATAAHNSSKKDSIHASEKHQDILRSHHMDYAEKNESQNDELKWVDPSFNHHHPSATISESIKNYASKNDIYAQLSSVVSDG
jgi:hypothetical protein